MTYQTDNVVVPNHWDLRTWTPLLAPQRDLFSGQSLIAKFTEKDLRILRYWI